MRVIHMVIWVMMCAGPSEEIKMMNSSVGPLRPRLFCLLGKEEESEWLGNSKMCAQVCVWVCTLDAQYFSC